MSCRLVIVALAMGGVVVSKATAQSAAAEAGEGAARLTIDGEAYNVPLGKAFALMIDGKRRTVRIDPVADREFRDAGVSFRYPAAMELTRNDADAAVTVWTLQGPAAAILLQRYAEGIDAESLGDVLVQNLVDQAGRDPKQQEVQLRGAEQAYRGAQIVVPEAEAGRETVHNVFAFEARGGVFALMIQDTRAAGGNESTEYSEALRLMGESFRTGPAPKAEAEKPPASPPRTRTNQPRRATPRGYRR